MSHLTSLQISIYVDEYVDESLATNSPEREAIEAHARQCDSCQSKLSAAQQERALLRDAMVSESANELTEGALVIPKFNRPTRLRDFALANIATGLVIWLAGFLWKTLFGELTITALTWLTSTYLPDIYTMTSAAALYFLQEGTAMINAYLGFIVMLVTALTATGLLLKYRKQSASAGLCLVALVSLPLLAPTPAHALEIMRDEDGVVTIPADTTIDDTLVIAADRIVVKGTITGDLFAFGRQVDVIGSIDGNLITFGELITVSGQVAGLTLGASSNFDVEGATLGGDLWAAGARVSVDEESSVASNSNLAAENIVVNGTVGKDLYAFAETTELSGKLGQDLEAFGASVRILEGASIAGDARLRVGKKDNLYREDTTQINGEITFFDLPEEFEPTSQYLSIEFYLWKLAQLVSSVLVGLALLWLIPGLANTSINGAMGGLKLAGIGLVAMVSLPVVAMIVAITLVGIPFSVVALFAWGLGLYLAKIIIAIYVGRSIYNDTRFASNWVVILITGMAAVIVMTNIPAIGGPVSFILTIIGLGLIATKTYDAFARRGDMIPA